MIKYFRIFLAFLVIWGKQLTLHCRDWILAQSYAHQDLDGTGQSAMFVLLGCILQMESLASHVSQVAIQI
jgi:hypothetical protein